jgi:maltose/maltodextrin transport system permease protein
LPPTAGLPLGFGIFVIFPLAYTVYIGFTKYSSQNPLRFDRSVALFHNETFLSPNAASYKYKLYAQEDGNYVLYLEDEKDATRRFASEPFELTPGVKPKTDQEPVKLNALPPGEEVKGKPEWREVKADLGCFIAEGAWSLDIRRTI